MMQGRVYDAKVNYQINLNTLQMARCVVGSGWGRGRTFCLCMSGMGKRPCVCDTGRT